MTTLEAEKKELLSELSDLVSFHEVRKKLNITRNALLKMVKAGQMPHMVRIGDRFFFKESEVNQCFKTI